MQLKIFDAILKNKQQNNSLNVKATHIFNFCMINVNFE